MQSPFLVHAPPKAPGTGLHAPAWQVVGWAQAVPHAPQFALSVWVSTHLPPQTVSEQVPPLPAVAPVPPVALLPPVPLLPPVAAAPPAALLPPVPVVAGNPPPLQATASASAAAARGEQHGSTSI